MFWQWNNIVPLLLWLSSTLRKKTNMKRRLKSWMTGSRRWVHACWRWRDIVSGWWVYLSFFTTGWNPCGIFREDSDEAGEDHRWLRRYGSFNPLILVVMCTVSNQPLSFLILNLWSDLSFFPSWTPSMVCTLLHFPPPAFSPLLTAMQMNCTLRSWSTRLSVRSWIMPSMIWTPCKRCIQRLIDSPFLWLISDWKHFVSSFLSFLPLMLNKNIFLFYIFFFHFAFPSLSPLSLFIGHHYKNRFECALIVMPSLIHIYWFSKTN